MGYVAAVYLLACASSRKNVVVDDDNVKTCFLMLLESYGETNSRNAISLGGPCKSASATVVIRPRATARTERRN